ncbi:MAG: hypothetical protein ACSHYA_08600 [Opitutaceae bacterium]
MKALLLCLSLAIPSILFASDQPALGQSLNETLKLLGKPQGTIELRGKTLLLYPQGEVTLKNDKVTHVDLMTTQEFEVDQARLKEEREEWALQQARDAEKRIAEGKKLRAYKMASGSFAKLPAKDRVDYWRSFQIRFPEIDVSEQIASSLAGYETELNELQAQHRIAELEARVAKAEKEAATARLEAQEAQNKADQASSSDKRYGLRYYTDPVANRRYYYRPPTVTIYTNGETNSTRHKQKEYKHTKTYTSPGGTAGRVSRILDTYHSMR